MIVLKVIIVTALDIIFLLLQSLQFPLLCSWCYYLAFIFLDDCIDIIKLSLCSSDILLMQLLYYCCWTPQLVYWYYYISSFYLGEYIDGITVTIFPRFLYSCYYCCLFFVYFIDIIIDSVFLSFIELMLLMCINFPRLLYCWFIYLAYCNTGCIVYYVDIFTAFFIFLFYFFFFV